MSLIYDGDVAGEDERAMACHDQMLAWLLKRGLPPYRLGIQSIDELGLPNDAMHNCFVACVTNSILWVSLRQDVMLINSQVSMHRLQSGEHWEYLSFTFPAFRHWLCPLDEANVLAWGAQDGQGQPVGLVLGHIGTSPAGTRVMELKSVYISPSARRHGLATRLLQAWIDDCRVQGFDELQSAPWIPNDLYPFYHEENAEMQLTFPPIVTERYSEKTQKRLKDAVECFNPGSRQQIASRLQSIGVEFTSFTETGMAKVDEEVLESIAKPEAKLIAEYLMLQKRLGLVKAWIDACTVAGKIHGKVLTNGAVTGRMTHYSPNLAQIPAVSAPYGKECRSLFRPSVGKVMVGIDASALELCMLAHYMKDDDFTKSVVEGKKEDKTDVHSRNQAAAGLPTRDQAKTFIYALLYGAGPGKIGAIVGGGAAEGAKLINTFMENMPKLAKLKHKTEKAAEVEGVTLTGLDGRRLRVRSAHSALNTKLQSAGAIVMKQALVILYNKILKYKLDAKFLLNVHDEWQLEVSRDHAEEVARLGVESIKEAGEALGLRCPLTGDARIGNNWAETH